MPASVISCPIDDTTKKKIDIVCGLKKIHQYEFITSAIEDKLKNENANDLMESYEKSINGKFENSAFFGKLRSIDEL